MSVDLAAIKNCGSYQRRPWASRRQLRVTRTTLTFSFAFSLWLERILLEPQKTSWTNPKLIETLPYSSYMALHPPRHGYTTSSSRPLVHSSSRPLSSYPILGNCRLLPPFPVARDVRAREPREAREARKATATHQKHKLLLLLDKMSCEPTSFSPQFLRRWMLYSSRFLVVFQLFSSRFLVKQYEQTRVKVLYTRPRSIRSKRRHLNSYGNYWMVGSIHLTCPSKKSKTQRKRDCDGDRDRDRDREGGGRDQCWNWCWNWCWKCR